jgi:hypothetical protein
VHTPPERSTSKVSTPGDHNRHVGFNPFRQQRRSPVDYVVLAAALAITVALLLWATGVL